MDPTIYLILLFLITILALLAERLAVPYPTVMIIGGLAICFIPGDLTHFDVNPKIIFTIFLPPLLYGAAWVTSWKDFTAYRRPIGYLAVALTLFTIIGIACVAKWLIPDMVWPAAFALGAIISPPDAIAVTALTKRMSVPRETLLVLEGESLVNDATALVALRFAVVAALTGNFSLAHAAGSFLVVVGGGVVAGLLTGWVACEVHKRLNDPLIETTISFLTAYAAYLLAEAVDTSGVLAVVTAGLFVSWQSPALFSPRTRLQATAVWEFVTFLLNGLVFVLIGLQLPHVLHSLPVYHSVAKLAFFVAALTATTIIIRLVSVIGGAALPKAIRWQGPGQLPRWRDIILIGWTGMRGVVSLAAAMALPAAFPGRDMILLVTFGVILITLVVQSLTLPMVIRLLRIRADAADFEEEREARIAAAKAGLTYISEITAATDAFGEIGPKLTIQYQQRITELEEGFAALPLNQVGVELSPFEIQKAVLDEERRILLEFRTCRRISYELFQRLMTEVDAEELRAEKQRMRRGRASTAQATKT